MLVLTEGLQDVRLAGEVSVGVLQAPQQTLLQDQDRDPELVPEQLHRPEKLKTILILSISPYRCVGLFRTRTALERPPKSRSGPLQYPLRWWRQC